MECPSILETNVGKSYPRHSTTASQPRLCHHGHRHFGARHRRPGNHLRRARCGPLKTATIFGTRPPGGDRSPTGRGCLHPHHAGLSEAFHILQPSCRLQPVVVSATKVDRRHQGAPHPDRFSGFFCDSRHPLRAGAKLAHHRQRARLRTGNCQWQLLEPHRGWQGTRRQVAQSGRTQFSHRRRATRGAAHRRRVCPESP